MKGIVEALSVLSLGGILYLNHHPNEAELERYKGFHQYNISEEEGNFILCNKTEHINITNLLKGYAHVSTVRMDNGHIVSIITKTSENPPAQLSKYINDKQDKGNLCKCIMEYQFSNCLYSQLKHSISYSIFNIIQCFTQMLPWEYKMKLKELIGQK